MILCEENYPKILDEISKYLKAGDIELVFVSSDEMQSINKEQRAKDKTTDVLSFPYNMQGCNLQGSIVINKQLANEVATTLKHSLEDEIALLFLHGILHILGYDHEKDNGQMRAKEEEIISYFNLPPSLIVRNS